MVYPSNTPFPKSQKHFYLKKERKLPLFPPPSPLSRLKTSTCVNRTRVIHVKTPAIVLPAKGYKGRERVCWRLREGGSGSWFWNGRPKVATRRTVPLAGSRGEGEERYESPPREINIQLRRSPVCFMYTTRRTCTPELWYIDIIYIYIYSVFTILLLASLWYRVIRVFSSIKTRFHEREREREREE